MINMLEYHLRFFLVAICEYLGNNLIYSPLTELIYYYIFINIYINIYIFIIIYYVIIYLLTELIKNL